ncbi:hypothetical protein P1U20_26630 [Escherichia coli]
MSKLDFAYRFCCDMGYAIDIRINEWLMPNLQAVGDLSEFQPEGQRFFHELICKEMESRHRIVPSELMGRKRLCWQMRSFGWNRNSLMIWQLEGAASLLCRYPPS